MSRTSVCPVPGCGELVPCPKHTRPSSAPWSRHRLDDRAERAELRAARLTFVGYRCERCGATDRPLELHHERGVELVPRVEHTRLLCVDCNRRAG